MAKVDAFFSTCHFSWFLHSFWCLFFVVFGQAGKTYQKYTTYYFNSGDNSQIVCLNWSNELEKDGHTDELSLSIGLKEYADFIELRAYN